MFDTSRFDQALNEAIQYLDTFEGLEPRSALKQAASNNWIAEGQHLQQFVRWAESKLFDETALWVMIGLILDTLLIDSTI